MKTFFTYGQFNHCSSKTTRWQKLLRPAIRLSLLLLLAFTFSANLTAQINVDGNPADWANFQANPFYATNAYSHDANNSNDNQFTQGSKDGMQISGWNWSNGQTNNKGDITNAAATLTFEDGHNMLSFCGDRAVNNGDAAIGFWFFKTPVALLGTTSGTFSGSHANGDLLVVSHFTNGGGQADIFIYKWSTAINGLLAPITSSNAAVNAIARPVPAGFAYASATYPIGDFFEGKIDLTTLGVAPCFTNFLLETRNSQAIDASLQDLTFGSFTQTVPPPSTTPAARCGSGNITLTASGCTGGTLNWYNAATGGTLVNTGTSYTVSISATTTFYVSCTTADGCLSARTPVTGTINGNPTVVANASPAGNVSIGSLPPHYNLSTTVNTLLNNSGFNYSWVQNPPQGATTGTLSSITIPNPSFTANIAQSFTWTVTATDKVTGCFNSAPVTRIIDPIAGCPLVPRSPVCSGTTNTYTADAGPAATETWVWSVNNGTTINAVPANGGQSISVTAGTQNFTLTLTKSFANTALPNVVCNYPVTVNPLAAPPAVTYIPPTCTQNTFSVQVTNPEVGSTYKLTQLDGNIVNIGPYVSGTLIFTGLHIGQGYSIVSTTLAGCKSNPNECGTFNVTPIASKPFTIDIEPVAAQPTVVAAPNPFSDKIRFSVKSPVSGQGSLELYNMLGQRVKILYQGNIEKGMVKTFEYDVPYPQRANLVYLFRIGYQKISGKLIGVK